MTIHKMRSPHPDPRQDAANAAKGRHSNYYAGVDRRGQFLDELRKGAKVAEAADAVGIKVTTYYEWRKKIKGFAGLVDAARAELMTGREQEILLVEREAMGEGVDPVVRTIYDRSRFFGHESPAFQAELIKQAHTMKKGDIAMVVLPPLHGKTTTYEDMVSLKFGHQPSVRTHVASEDIKLSKKILARIRRRMEPPPGDRLWDYVMAYGPFAPPKEKDEKHQAQPWTETYFDVRGRRGSDERDYSMAALGFGSGILGTRSDWLHCDDLQSKKTIGRTETYLEIFQQDWISRPADEGILTIYCNLVDDGDIYSAIMDEYRDQPFFHLIFYPAIVYREGKPQPLWPERWTMEALETQKAKVTPSAFERNWMMRPTSKDLKTFQPDVIEEAKDHHGHLKRRSEGGLCYIALDPNIGPGITCLLAVETTSNQLIPIDLRQKTKMATNEEILAYLEAMIWDLQEWGWKVTDVICESVYMQKGLARDRRLMDMRVKYGFAVREHNTGDNKYDENIGVPSMPSSFIQGEVVIPYALEEDRYTQHAMDILIADLKRWRPKKRGSTLRQDALMTLWFAWTLWKSRRGAVADTSALSLNVGGMPFTPTSSGLIVPTAYTPIMAGAR